MYLPFHHLFFLVRQSFQRLSLTSLPQSQREPVHASTFPAQYLVTLEEWDDFTFIDINMINVITPYQAYSLLWEAIKGDRVGPSQALGLLESEFSTPSPRSVPLIVLMDALDPLVTRGQGACTISSIGLEDGIPSLFLPLRILCTCRRGFE
ncbi:hypothetical protein L873DRAFT_980301 [Choiromyces venosus 120613-1]|uniref:Origin recognition complex subunit 1 n=1 Tax=Choiromyces venosus 120613-1 TaxID=1336337 RepID=A0A3N4JP57_9PEZI|nr:hypothetical protein L873DRAFT_980301 [Choiromyces venosus 120613-1]